MKSTRHQRLHVLRRAVRLPVVKTALATGISLALATAQASVSPAGKVRLTLNDEISSRTDKTADSFAGRVEVNGLIQSHPDPVLTELEERYRALPPLDYASEEIPERFIAGPTPTERVMGTVRNITSDVAGFIPSIKSSVRYDAISDKQPGTDNSNPVRQSSSTAIATINPTFLYEADTRKWKLRAQYDYERSRYAIDRSASINDHVLDADWTLRLDRGNEFAVSARIENTHDRRTKDPILDFNSSLESQDLSYDRKLVNVRYRNGAREDRSRYEVYLFTEEASLDADELFGGGYKLDRIGVGGTWAWRLRRQFSLLAEARYHDFDYNLAFRDNDHFRALFGGEMLLGRRLRANLRLGIEEKNFDQSITDDAFHETVWRGLVEWALRRRTSVKLETGRDIYELATVDRPIDVDKFNIQQWLRTEWQERWTDKFATQTSYTIRETDFKGRDGGETAQQLLVSGIYQATSRLKIALDGAYTRQETDFGAETSRRTFTVRTDFAL